MPTVQSRGQSLLSRSLSTLSSSSSPTHPSSSSTITTPPARPSSSLFSARVPLAPSFLLYCSPHQRSCIFPFVHRLRPYRSARLTLSKPQPARVDITGASLIDIPSTRCETTRPTADSHTHLNTDPCRPQTQTDNCSVSRVQKACHAKHHLTSTTTLSADKERTPRHTSLSGVFHKERSSTTTRSLAILKARYFFVIP